MAQVKFLKITSGIITKVSEANDSISVHSLGLGIAANFTDGYSLSIINSTGAPTTPEAGISIYSNSGIFKIKQSDGGILGGFAVGGDLTGTASSQTVSKINGNAISSQSLSSIQDGYVLTWINGSSEYQVKPINGILINQSSHGFSTGQALYYTGSAWALAKANAVNTLGIGIAVYIDANNFNLYQSGKIAGLSGLTAGQYYFVSDATSGLLTTTEPSDIDSYSNPLLFALSETTGLVLPFRPSSSNSVSPYVTHYDHLLTNDPITSCSYASTIVDSLITNKSWISAAILIKNIAYTYVDGLCSQEVRKVYATDGITIVAQLTIAYTYTLGILSSAIYTRNI